MEPFLGMLMPVSFNFAPKGWALCNGQLLPINQNQALFALLGTTFGGDGRVNFALPNLQSRVPIGSGGGFTLGQVGGEESVTLSLSTVPFHQHAIMASTDATSVNDPVGNVLGQATMYFQSQAPDTLMSPAAITTIGGSQPHTNIQPFLVINWVIALQGIFPSPN